MGYITRTLAILIVAAALMGAGEITCTATDSDAPTLNEGEFIMQEVCPGDSGCESHRITAVCTGGCHPEDPPDPVPATRSATLTWEAPTKTVDGSPLNIVNYMVNYSQTGTNEWKQHWVGADQLETILPEVEIGKEYTFQLFVQEPPGVMSVPAELTKVVEELE